MSVVYLNDWENELHIDDFLRVIEAMVDGGHGSAAQFRRFAIGSLEGDIRPQARALTAAFDEGLGHGLSFRQVLEIAGDVSGVIPDGCELYYNTALYASLTAEQRNFVGKRLDVDVNQVETIAFYERTPGRTALGLLFELGGDPHVIARALVECGGNYDVFRCVLDDHCRTKEKKPLPGLPDWAVSELRSQVREVSEVENKIGEERVAPLPTHSR